ncbi:MAG TPA: hypothetical protein VIF15_15840 [Polyangiaceae bacterium]|jgi:hypothetical protein
MTAQEEALRTRLVKEATWEAQYNAKAYGKVQEVEDPKTIVTARSVIVRVRIKMKDAPDRMYEYRCDPEGEGCSLWDVDS